ncbi:hypothetical protein HN014_16575 [Aquimarina sp. TRL1]|uniref:hypothetical protein n=1 Tax=Aquimarina sp. (strain TRL1) TaxID=2736252 RepID=UPI00158DDCD5|nr:hypothetical protein [Aquimarina sp. TRL1]QKX06459.1 hypothetical protein HN014_16575 [Aquimarina sp. TRL1]
MKPAFIILVFLISSCQSGNTDLLEKNTYQIVSLLIDEFGTSLKFDHPQGEKKADLDTNSNPTIGINKVLKFTRERLNLSNKKEEKSYLKLLETFNTFREDINLDLKKIKVKEGYNLIFIDTTKTKQEQYNKYDRQLYLSRISFDKNYKKALTTISIKNGGYYLCLLNNIKGNWEIEKSEMLYIY